MKRGGFNTPVHVQGLGLPTSLRPEMYGTWGATWWAGKGGLSVQNGQRKTGFFNIAIRNNSRSMKWARTNTRKAIEGIPIRKSYVPFNSSSGVIRGK